MWFLLLCSLAFADDTVITLNEGDPDPFAGTLLSPEAAAKIIVSSDTTLQTCLINSERDLALQEANLTLQIRNKEAELAACTLRLTENQQLYEQHINFLEKQAIRPQWETPVYFAVGVLTGAAMVYGSSVVLKNIGSN